MQQLHYDVLIIGGGLVGLSLAKGLEKQGISYCLVENNLIAKKTVTRSLALSKTSIAILKYLDVWDNLTAKVTAIETIHVSAQGQWGHLLLEADTDEKLGVIIDLNDLQAELMKQLQHSAVMLNGSFVEYLPNTQIVRVLQGNEHVDIHAKLVIAADGALSSVRTQCGMPVEVNQEQIALIGTLILRHPHAGRAFERFTKFGPLALLPVNTHDMSIVWSITKEHEELVRQNFAVFVEQQLGGRMGPVVGIEYRTTYPLRQIFMPVQVFNNILFLGNAAHCLHPVAGQGFNLSLRDVITLLDCLKKYSFTQELLPIYLLKRRRDQRFTQQLTQFLAQGFVLIPAPLQGLGLSLLGNFSWLKKLFSHYAQGLGYVLPVEIYQYLESLDE